MELLKRIKAALFSNAQPAATRGGDPNGLFLYVRCGKCGSPIRIRADRRHDLQRDYDTGELILRKEIMDASCFRLIYATVRYDTAYRVVEQEIEGGEFLTEEAFAQLAAPPADPDESTEGEEG